ncbi:unnamed protein product [Prorocentrum cordatum]|uniref:Uncharacterized protein n=1 Tax=Prorocentrum cordatum TaxID=2364126 RepID=A0ABN9YBK5_9DINO|nr:unnamed protein product [Polarella glacialis]
MAGARHASFSTTVELICFDAESGIRSPGSFQHVEMTGARGTARRSSPTPARGAPAGRGGASTAPWPWPSSAAAVPDLRGLLELEAECLPSSPSTEPGGSGSESFADENLFAKVAQRRRIRRSVTANQGPGLPQHALPEMTMSRILMRRRSARSSYRVDSSCSGTSSISSLGE